MSKRLAKGDVLVPRGLRFPEGAREVVRRDGEHVEISPLGGGVVQRAPAALVAWDHRVATAEEMESPPLRLAAFTLDGCYEADVFFEGWHDGRRWNGWATPLFERAALLRIVDELGGRWDEAAKTATFGDADEALEQTAVTLRLDPRVGKEVGGFDGWCFYEPTEEGDLAWHKACGCGRCHTAQSWERLKLLGRQPTHAEPGEAEHGWELELRNCACGSTLTVLARGEERRP